MGRGGVGGGGSVDGRPLVIMPPPPRAQNSAEVARGRA